MPDRDDALWESLERIRTKAEDVAMKTSTHEAVCAERYLGIQREFAAFRAMVTEQADLSQRWRQYIMYAIISLGAADVMGVNKLIVAVLQRFTGV